MKIMDESILDAYDFLVKNEKAVEDRTGQLYNFLYCLAALAEQEEEALTWLEEAIINRKMWYRPEVFEDDDLDLIKENLRFQKCVNLSKFRFENAIMEAKSICTWETVSHDNLLLVLHGNQQNIQIARENWDQLNHKYQVEYLQSSQLDSKDLYRWEVDGDGYKELLKALENIDTTRYKSVTLAGFSAGCHVILKALVDGFFVCNKVILQSPWIPEITENHKEVVKVLMNHKVDMTLICGDKDEDCYPLAKLLEQSCTQAGVHINCHWIEGMDHEYPVNFKDLV